MGGEKRGVEKYLNFEKWGLKFESFLTLNFQDEKCMCVCDACTSHMHTE